MDEPSIFQIFLKVIVHVCPFPFAAQHRKVPARKGLRMNDFAIFWDWLSFAVRWLHVITGIAWIGSSFYFVALDLGLRQRPGLPAGAFGEEWQVHGGGFYHIQKYLVAPAEMPEHLTWFKWESYATWLSGFAHAVRRLLCRRRSLS